MLPWSERGGRGAPRAPSTSRLGRGRFLGPPHELAGRAAHRLPEQVFFGGRVRVEAAALQVELGGDVTHRGGVVAALGEEPHRDLVHLGAPRPLPLSY